MLAYSAFYYWNERIDYDLQYSAMKSTINASNRKLTVIKSSASGSYINKGGLVATSTGNSAKDFSSRVVDEMQKDAQEAIDIQTTADAKIEKTAILNKRLTMIFNFGLAGVILGLVLSVFGFLEWYLKVQRYIDRDVRRGNKPSSRRFFRRQS